MGKKIILILFFNFFIVILLNQTVVAGLKINEVFPRPSPGVDWVEFYNSSDEMIDLTNYILTDVAGNRITFSCWLNPKGFITVDWGENLNNAGDTIKLKNGDNIIDCLSYGNGANDSCGDLLPTRLPTPGYNQSLARVRDGDGQWIATASTTKNGPNDGSLKNPDAICVTPTLTPTPTPTLTPTPIPTQVPTNTSTPISTPTPIPTPSPTPLISVGNIYLSEVMVYPPTGESEWVEIYNDNDFSVSLVKWYIDDEENSGATPRTFSLELPPKSYQVFELSSSIFNNTGDSVRLLDANKVLKDSFEYQDPRQGKTYGRIYFDADNFCLQEPSKGLANYPCLNFFSTAKPTPKPTPYLTPSPATELPTFSPQPILKTNNPMTDVVRPNQSTGLSLYQNPSAGEMMGEVMGEATERKKVNKPLAQGLSFLSFSYSVLTMLSLIIKRLL